MSLPLSVKRQRNVTGIRYRTGIYNTEDSQLSEIGKACEREQRKAHRTFA